ncbi:M3 family oligoendopeptidase [archaeon]|nr:M3 family oligoendopeptidase [archaeon]
MKTEWEFPWAKPEEFLEERKKIEKAHDEFVLKWKNRKDYLENPETLLLALEDYEELIRYYSGGGREGYYYWLNQGLNQLNMDLRKNYLQVEEFSNKQSNKLLFFDISIGKIPVEKQKEFLEKESLKKYREFLKKIFENSKHILSEAEEKILSLKESGSYGLWVKMVESLLSKETFMIEGKEKTFEELITLTKSKDKDLRMLAKEGFEKILEKYEEIAEVELNAVLENAKVNDELRGFTKPDEARINTDSIDYEFINSLLDSVKENFSISHKYYSILAKLIGQEKIDYSERGVEVGEIAKEYEYNEAINLVKDVFSNLDKTFLELFEEMLASGKIDAFPKKGKMGGAFCVHFGLYDPVYILLNFTKDLHDVSTIAHEMGHAINFTFSKEKENSLNFGIPEATGEVASIFMEDFVFKKILSESTEEEKFYLLFKKIGEDISSIFRQIALYLFELEIHNIYRKEGYLSKEKIGEIFVKHMSSYMGEDVTMEKANLWWIYWSHIRMYFYVYSYASGTLISKTIQAKYREDNSFIEKIKIFLETGKSKSPREIFREMGIEIDKEFFTKGILEIKKNLDEVEELGKKLGKL